MLKDQVPVWVLDLGRTAICRDLLLPGHLQMAGSKAMVKVWVVPTVDDQAKLSKVRMVYVQETISHRPTAEAGNLRHPEVVGAATKYHHHRIVKASYRSTAEVVDPRPIKHHHRTTAHRTHLTHLPVGKTLVQDQT